MDDPDLGHRAHVYNVLGELIQSTDAKNQITTYDVLGRINGRTGPDMTSAWTYDTAAKGVGKLATTSATGTAAGGSYNRAHFYDTLGRPSQVQHRIDNALHQHSISTAYDADGRVLCVTYGDHQRHDWCCHRSARLRRVGQASLRQRDG